MPKDTWPVNIWGGAWGLCFLCSGCISMSCSGLLHRPGFNLVSTASSLPRLQRFGLHLFLWSSILGSAAFPGHCHSICPKGQMPKSNGLMPPYPRQRQGCCRSASSCCSGTGRLFEVMCDSGLKHLSRAFIHSTGKY